MTTPVHTDQDRFLEGVCYDEHKIASSTNPDVTLHLSERRSATTGESIPLLLVHGATIASVLWDNPHPGWSWMNRLALDGFHVFAIDLRGYGRSSRPASFSCAPQDNLPYARAHEVVQDVLDALAFVQNHTGQPSIDLLGGSWGSIICGKLVAERREAAIRRLVLYAPLYCEPESRPQWLPAAHEAQTGAYRQVGIEDLKARWDDEIPVSDPSLWRPPGVFEAIAQRCLRDDAKNPWATDGGFRAPAGTIADLEQVYLGQPLYDGRRIDRPTLLLRGSADPVSTHSDASRLFEKISSQIKQYTVIGNGAHFMIAERVFGQVHQVVRSFLTASF